MSWVRLGVLVVCPFMLVAQPVASGKLTQAEQEEFLRTAKAVSSKMLSKGVTGAKRMQMEKDGFEHDAQFQPIDKLVSNFHDRRRTELNFKDSYKFNIAAYELGKMLGIADMIPPSIQRRVGGTTGAVTWWVDGVMMDEGKRMHSNIQPPDSDRWNREVQVLRVFDQLIANTDRNLGNLLITQDWNIWMIDHTRAFRPDRDLLTPGNLTRCDRNLLGRMKQLTKTSLKEQVGSWLTGTEIDGLLARRDKILAAFDGLMKEKGEDSVLFDRPKRD